MGVGLRVAEYPPNMGHGTGLGDEDRMSWMTVGTVSWYVTSVCIELTFAQAVRLGYLLGLEKLGMQAEDLEEKLAHDRDRGKVAWSCKSSTQPGMANILTVLQIASCSTGRFLFA